VVLAFDGHFLDLERRELRRGAALIKLEPKVFDLLDYLLRHRGRVVGKDELIEAIWRGRVLSDSALTTRINAVRRAIGDTGIEQRLIRTLPRKGYRFVGEVGETVATQGTSQSQSQSNAKRIVPAPVFADRASIAVLPFTAISGDLNERCFADGLVEDVVTALSRFRWLAVLAPTSRLAPWARALDARRMDSDLGTRYVVQGAIRGDGGRLRVTAHLIEAVTRAVLWSDRFDGFLADALELQDKIASLMAGSIEPTLQSAEARRCSASSNSDVTPYALHVQAHPIFSNGKENVLRSLDLLERAIELDSKYGSALADAANCRQILDVNGWTADRRLNRRKAVGLARMALQFSSDPEPVAISAFVLAYFGEDIDAAAVLLDNALRLNPSFAKGWYMSGMTQLYAGRPEQAIGCFETSIRLNPRDRIGRRNIVGIGIAHFFSRRFDDAVPILRTVIQDFPRWATPYCALASCLAHLNFLRESEAIARRLKATDASLVPNAIQFRDAKHRELLAPGLKLAGTVGHFA
jgi:TolB-like protein